MSALASSPGAIFAFYAGLNGLILLALAVFVVRARITTQTGIGDGGKEAMIKAQRAHGNAAEYIPIVLILLYVLSTSGAPIWLLHAVGGGLTLGRLLHAQGLHKSTGVSFGRFAGTNLTGLTLLAASVGAIYYALT